MSWLVGIVKWGASLFATEKAGDVVLKIAERAAGVEWTPQEQADFLIEYQKATAHQSVMRRVVVFAIVFGMAFYGFGYFMTAVICKYYVFFATSECDPLLVDFAGESIGCLSQMASSQNLAEIRIKPLLELKNDLLIYMKDILNEPFTYAVMFYLGIGLGDKIKFKGKE